MNNIASARVVYYDPPLLRLHSWDLLGRCMLSTNLVRRLVPGSVQGWRAMPTRVAVAVGLAGKHSMALQSTMPGSPSSHVEHVGHMARHRSSYPARTDMATTPSSSCCAAQLALSCCCRRKTDATGVSLPHSAAQLQGQGCSLAGSCTTLSSSLESGARQSQARCCSS